MIDSQVMRLKKDFGHWKKTFPHFVDSESLPNILNNIIDCIEKLSSGSKNNKKQSAFNIPEGFTLLSEWDNFERNKFIASGTIRSGIANDSALRSKAKKINRTWYINPQEIWDYYWNSDGGMHNKIKKKQKLMEHLWIIPVKS